MLTGDDVRRLAVSRPLLIGTFALVAVLVALRFWMGPGEVPLHDWEKLWPQLVKDAGHILSGVTLGAGIAFWRHGHRFLNGYIVSTLVLVAAEFLTQGMRLF
jgi:hypothetical protein